MKREQWGSRKGFLFATLGSVIGLGNLWRFPYIAYDNGGGAFLIPYFIAMLTVGVPFVIMEFALGQRFRRSAPMAFKRINRHMEWLGWFQVAIAVIICIYYSAIIGWVMSFFQFSFTQAWGIDTNTFFFHDYLQLSPNSTPSELGTLQWHILIPMLIAWALCFLVLVFGIKRGIERVSVWLIPILFLFITLLAVRVAFLPGALQGLNYLFEPDFSQLLNSDIWAAAYGQIFFTLSVGFSILIAYTSYLPKKSDINNNACLLVFSNAVFSLIAGVLVFGVLGYMAEMNGQAVTSVISAGIGLVFVTLPAAINLLPMPSLVGPLFFFCLLIAGLSSQISVLEGIIAAIMDKWHLSRRQVCAWVCGVGFGMSVFFATSSGLYLLDIIDYFTNNIGLLMSCLIEMIFIGWWFQAERIRQYANQLSDFKVNRSLNLSLRFITPLMLTALLLNHLITTLSVGYSSYHQWDLMLFGWGLLFIMITTATVINLNLPLRLSKR